MKTQAQKKFSTLRRKVKQLLKQSNRLVYKDLKPQIKQITTPEDLAFLLLDNEQEKVLANVFPRDDIFHYFKEWIDVSYEAKGNIAKINLDNILNLVQEGINTRGSSDITNLPAYDDMIDMATEASLDALSKLHCKIIQMYNNIMEVLDRRDAEAREKLDAIEKEQEKLRKQLIDIHGDDTSKMDPAIAKLLFPESNS